MAPKNKFSKRKMLRRTASQWNPYGASNAVLKGRLLTNNNNHKLYLHDHNKVLQYYKSYLKLLIDSL